MLFLEEIVGVGEEGLREESKLLLNLILILEDLFEHCLPNLLASRCLCAFHLLRLHATLNLNLNNCF